MSLSINDFFKCPVSLNRLHNCGFLSSYLNPFAQWMAKQQFADFTIRSHITNVAHLSQSLDQIARLDAPGVLQHIIIRGIERRLIFRDSFDRGNFLERLSMLVPETRTIRYAWIFMSKKKTLAGNRLCAFSFW